MGDTADQCGFDGNSDIYGLGVRLGIYLQWTTSVVAENLHEPAVATTREANTTFQLAMLAGLILITAGDDVTTKTIEGYIALLFCFASAWIASLQSYSAARASFAGAGAGNLNVGGQGGLLLGTATCSYGVWFLFVGLDKLPRTACPEIVFFFAPVQAFGWFRVLAEVVVIVSLIGSAILIPIHAYLLVREMVDSMARWANPGNPSPRQTALVRTVHLHVPRFLGSLVALALFITAVELTLAWNHIRGVNTCNTFSQLFPLVVGAANFARLGYQLCKSLILGDARVQYQMSKSLVWGTARVQ